MGAVFSLNSSRNGVDKPFEGSNAENSKRQKMSSSCYENETRLILSLPNEVSLHILARLPRISYLNVRLVSRSWRAAITSAELYNLRKELGTTEEWLYILTKVGDDKLLWYALDPLSRKWQRLPPMPLAAYEESRKGLGGLQLWNVMSSSVRIAKVIRGLLGRKDALDQMAFCGCAIGALDGCLYVLGGFSRSSAMKCVWKYDPVSNAWSEASSMSTDRAYCKTGILNNKLYVVGGVTKGPGRLTPLESAEVFDPKTGIWSQIPSMPFSKAEMLPAGFLAGLLKPIATGMTSYRGKLFAPQSLYCWPFFVDVGGEVYDPETNSWVDMPTGMGEGWPARQAGTKLSVTVNGELYALDSSGSSDSAKIKVYDFHSDAWKVASGDVPIRSFTDSESPYLLACILGRLHVITMGPNLHISVMQADVQNVLGSLPSTSSSLSDDLSSRLADLTEDPDANTWKVIATRSATNAELVGCQTLVI